MDNRRLKQHDGRRTLFQVVFAVITNGYIKGFIEGKIFQGASKQVCLPGLNCYSCPGALGSCPLGAMQAVSNDRNFMLPLYAAGALTVMGAVFGRLICGWMCPFGLVQDLIYKIPVGGKLKRIPADRYLRWIKYVILAVFILILPMFFINDFGQGDPWFCKYICPAGTLMAGWPLAIVNQGLRGALGFLFVWKSVILVILIVLSLVLYRPFCKYLCPLGAIYGCFNRISLYQMRCNHHQCIECGQCSESCKMNLVPRQQPNSAECIRCGHCIKACKIGALRGALDKSKKEGGE